MGEPFDLYCSASAEPFREGAVVMLDGIDGFFDQYFEAARPGQTIRFAVLVGNPSDVPHSIRELEAMPFVTARVERCDALGGEVEVLSRTTLGAWSRCIELSTQSPTELQLQVPDAPLHELVVQASRTGSAYWKSGVKHWRSLDGASAVGAFRDDSTIRGDRNPYQRCARSGRASKSPHHVTTKRWPRGIGARSATRPASVVRPATRTAPGLGRPP